MAARPAPPLPEIVAGSTPVVSFGDPLRARVASLGINPSSREFVDTGVLLTGELRRLETMESLGAVPGRELDVDQARAVVRACDDYFTRNPYRRWFDPLDQVLTSAFDDGYYTGTACHLDLVQWATDPAWGRLRDPETRRVLLEEGRAHLQALLALPNLQMVVCNGRSVIDQVIRLGLCSLAEVARIGRQRDTCRLFTGQRGGVVFLGWTTNLQSSHGVSRPFLDELSRTIRALAGSRKAIAESASGEPAPLSARAPKVRRPQRSKKATEDSKYLPPGLTVTSKRDLAEVLTAWLQDSDAQTIGDPDPYGGRKWISIDVAGARAYLNADTSRSAVARYLDQVQRDGADLPWQVVATRSGVIRKVVFGSHPSPVTGWNCYLERPRAQPGPF